MTEIEVDFNSRGAHGTVRGSLRRAGNVSRGDRVVLVDPEEEMRFNAVVDEVDHALGRVVYSVDWSNAETEPVEMQGYVLLHDLTSQTLNARPKIIIEVKEFDHRSITWLPVSA